LPEVDYSVDEFERFDGKEKNPFHGESPVIDILRRFNEPAR